LFDGAAIDVAIFFQVQLGVFGDLSVFMGMSGMEIIHLDVKSPIVPLVFLVYPGDVLLWSYALFFGAQHDCGAMCIIGTDEHAVIAA